MNEQAARTMALESVFAKHGFTKRETDLLSPCLSQIILQVRATGLDTASIVATFRATAEFMEWDKARHDEEKTNVLFNRLRPGEVQ